MALSATLSSGMPKLQSLTGSKGPWWSGLQICGEWDIVNSDTKILQLWTGQKLPSFCL